MYDARWEMFRHAGYCWRNFQPVCFRWRQTVLHTPALWSVIRIPDPPQAYDQVNIDNIAMCIQRAGVLPLTVCVGASIDEQLFPLLSAILPRIEALQVTSNLTESLEIFRTREASKLRCLALCNRSDVNKLRVTDGGGPLHGLQLPQLQTLISQIKLSWYPSNFQALRYLVLREQQILYNLPRAELFLRLLDSTPLLEDLVLEDHSEDIDSDIEMDELPSVTLPRLRRLSIKGTKCVMFIESKVDLPIVEAKVYRDLKKRGLAVDFTGSYEQGLALERKVYLDPLGTTIVTDGQTSLCVEPSEDLRNREAQIYVSATLQNILKLYTTPSNTRPVKVRELWLGWRKLYGWRSGAAKDATDRVVDILRDMDGVEKVVLWGNVRFWLRMIAKQSLFPAMTELQIHDIRDRHESRLFHFLSRRMRDGFPVQCLRFEEEGERRNASPFEPDSTTSVLGRAEREFSGQLVVHSRAKDGLARIKLPEVCTTPSTEHPNWPSWQTEYADVWPIQIDVWYPSDEDDEYY